jgi:hypothetical protein
MAFHAWIAGFCLENVDVKTFYYPDDGSCPVGRNILSQTIFWGFSVKHTRMQLAMTYVDKTDTELSK